MAAAIPASAETKIFPEGTDCATLSEADKAACQKQFGLQEENSNQLPNDLNDGSVNGTGTAVDAPNAPAQGNPASPNANAPDSTNSPGNGQGNGNGAGKDSGSPSE